MDIITVNTDFIALYPGGLKEPGTTMTYFEKKLISDHPGFRIDIPTQKYRIRN